MQIFNIGPTELDVHEISQFDQEKYVWAVYWYEYSMWEGEGEFIALGKDGKLYWLSLSHCSCYNPTDDPEDRWYVMTVPELLREKDSIFDFELRDEVDAKVRSLLCGG